LGIEHSASPDLTTVDDDPRRNGGELVAALLPSQLPPSQAAPERPRWEYRTELLERGFMGFGSGQVDLRALEKRLDELGAEGWELVHATWDQSVRGKRGGHLLLFKRPRVASPASD
jgi:hypothetical protein